MARLDSEHRLHLVERYFPNASHQVIILSTDTEVDQDFYAKLQPHIARAYHLNYDEAEKVTLAREGYFWQPASARTAGRRIARKKRMNIKQIRLSAQGKEQLIRLKTRTGINQWNIVCRWAFCLSLREPTPPSPIDVPADSNVEMTWPVFAANTTSCTWPCSRSGSCATASNSPKRNSTGSSGCTCTEASVTSPARIPYDRLRTSSAWHLEEN